MWWVAFIQVLRDFGFSNGEAVCIACMMIIMVQHQVTIHRLKVRSEAAAKDRATLWQHSMRVEAEAKAAMQLHERTHHADSDAANEPSSN